MTLDKPIIVAKFNRINKKVETVQADLANITIDVKQYGVVGNANYYYNDEYYEDAAHTIVASDDTAKLIDAFTAFLALEDGAKITIPQNCNCKISDEIIVDFGNKSNLKIDIQGSLRPIKRIGYCLKITNAKYPTLNIKIEYGGVYKYIEDFGYNTTGLDVGLYLKDCYGVDLTMIGNYFTGRCIEVDTGCVFNSFKKLNFSYIGQSMFVKSGSAIGNLGDIYIFSEIDGGYYECGDLTISGYENVFNRDIVDDEGNHLNHPVKFYKVSGTHLHKIAVGETGDYVVELNECTGVIASDIYCWCKDGDNNKLCSGLKIIKSARMKVNVFCDYSEGYGLYIDGLYKSEINYTGFENTREVYITSDSSEFTYNKISVNGSHSVNGGINVVKGTNNIHTSTIVCNIDSANTSETVGEYGVKVNNSAIELDFINLNNLTTWSLPANSKCNIINYKELKDSAMSVIYNTTLTEASNIITISTDNNGNNFSLMRAQVNIYVPAGCNVATGSTATLQGKINDITTGYHDTQQNSDNASSCCFGAVRNLYGQCMVDINIIAGACIGKCNYFYSDGTTRSNGTQLWSLGSGVTSLTKFAFTVSSSYTLPAGTIIELRGTKT